MPGNLQNIPASVIASWPTPNYIDPVRRTWMPAYAGVLQVVMTLMLGTRLWLRTQKKAGALGLDDVREVHIDPINQHADDNDRLS